jgi:hypothetical protein
MAGSTEVKVGEDMDAVREHDVEDDREEVGHEDEPDDPDETDKERASRASLSMFWYSCSVSIRPRGVACVK